MRQVVSFDKLKLTNNELDDQGHVSDTTVSFLFAGTAAGSDECPVKYTVDVTEVAKTRRASRVDVSERADEAR